VEIICRFCSSFLLQTETVLGMWTEVKSDCVYMCVGSQPVVWYIQKHIFPMLIPPLLSMCKPFPLVNHYLEEGEVTSGDFVSP
jgi:hypothetical protein